MDDEWEGIWKKSLAYYLCICLEIMSKITEILVRLAYCTLRLELTYLQDIKQEFLSIHQVWDIHILLFL